MKPLRRAVHGNFIDACYHKVKPEVTHEIWEYIIDEINTPVIGGNIRRHVSGQVRE